MREDELKSHVGVPVPNEAPQTSQEELSEFPFRPAISRFFGNEETAQPPKVSDGFSTNECSLCLVSCRTKSVDEEEEFPLLAVHCERKLQC